MPATLASTFTIYYDGPSIGAGTSNSILIANQNLSPFTIVSMSVEGANNATATLTRSITGGSVVLAKTCTTASPGCVGLADPANATVPPGENLVITAAAAAIERAEIVCRHYGLPLT